MMSSNVREKSLWVKILWVLCRSVAIMPYWMQYGCVANIVYLLMRYVVRYRRSLIIKQLTDSFPEKSLKEIKSICNDYYHTLAEVVVGTMTLAGITKEQKAQLLELELSDQVKEIVKDRHFVYLSSHLNMWEFAQFSNLEFDDHYTLFAYHPLTSPTWEELYLCLRCGEHAQPIPSGQFMHFFLRHRESGVEGRKMLLGLIADQNAAPKGEVHWYNFLNRPTLFFDGGEQLALKFKLPVLYLGMSRTKAGRYKGEVTLLYDGEEQVEKFEITERYVRKLEEDIKREPSRWMWSHRRWKYYPDPETGEVKYRKKGV